MKKTISFICCISIGFLLLSSCNKNASSDSSSITSEKVIQTQETNEIQGVTSSESNSSEYSMGLSYRVLDDNTCTILGLGTCRDQNIRIGQTIDGYTVTEIAGSAFDNTGNMQSIVLPDTVTRIGVAAFLSCYELTNITIPKNVKDISDKAFSKCTNLVSVTIPVGVTIIGKFAFEGCTKLTNITYGGTQSQWMAIKKYPYWDAATGDYIITCSDGIIYK